MISASTIAPQIDHIFFSLLIFSVVLSLCVFITIGYFLIKYRASKKVNRQDPRKHQRAFETLWVVGSLVLFIPFFVWGAVTFFSLYVPASHSVEINVVAKQWMWKFYHPDGTSEINTLHVALGQPVRLVLTSEDVVHSFFVPDFRVKQDVLPARYTSLWFTPTLTGKFHFLCTQYCGTDHAGMNGYVIVMNPADFENWRQTFSHNISFTQSGQQLYHKLQCMTCHGSSTTRGPDLHNIMGKNILMSDGSKVFADKNYLKESILNPSAKVVKGYKDIMPSYQGQVSEAELLSLVEYINSLTKESERTP